MQALQNGPISVVIAVYNDFLEYSSGVYVPNKGSGLEGYIQMRLIGYGATTGTSPVKYWIGALVRARAFCCPRPSQLTCAFTDVGHGIWRGRVHRPLPSLYYCNTLARYIRIVRGEDACGIENGVLGYCPAQLVAA